MTFQEWAIIVAALEEQKSAYQSQADQELAMIKQFEQVIADNDITNTNIPNIPGNEDYMEKVHDDAVLRREEYVTNYAASKKKVAEIKVVLSKILHTELRID